MAVIAAATDERVFQISKWLGLNENPDGDTKLKMGEAAVMRNFKITRDWNLQRRPGSAEIVGLMDEYAVSVADGAEAAKVDTGVCATLTMYPTASVNGLGLPVLSGTSVNVSYDNAETYVGYYWRYNDFFFWKLVSCVYAEEADTYTWNMKRVTAASASENSRVAGLWTGYVDGEEQFVAACDGKLWRLWDETTAAFVKEEIGNVTTTGKVHLFGFSGNLYILDGAKYLVWDGSTLSEVTGYVPCIRTASPPAGGGTAFEQVNKLTATKKQRFSGDNAATVYQLAEADIASVDAVTVGGAVKTPTTHYTVNLTTGAVTFTSGNTPPTGTNNVEIQWTGKTDDRTAVTAMKFSELFNGTQDNRVFLYGDGSNSALYSGLDEDGAPRADYFPDLNVLDIGSENTPITAMTRHYSTLIVHKTDGTYAVGYGTITLADGSTTAAFYKVPVNSSIGNVAPGQVRLVLNSPRSLFGSDIYEWRNNASYSSNLTLDERQAKRISDRVYATLYGFDLADCVTWDDSDNQEYYVCNFDTALVHNYAADAWYYYTSFDAVCFANFHGSLYFGTSAGQLRKLSYDYRTDNGAAIDAYWESGSMAFGREFRQKYSGTQWITIKPEANGEVIVSAETDKRGTYSEITVVSSLATFEHANFRRWSFNTNRKPHVKKVKIKAKKFVYFKLRIENGEADTTATILSFSMLVQYTGDAK